jgi:hypothetical protein
MTNNVNIVANQPAIEEIRRGMPEKSPTICRQVLPSGRFTSPDRKFRLNARQNSATIPVRGKSFIGSFRLSIS